MEVNKMGNRIKLEAQRIKRMNEYHYVSIPKALIDNNVLSLNKKYVIIIVETDEKKEEVEKE